MIIFFIILDSDRVPSKTIYFDLKIKKKLNWFMMETLTKKNQEKVFEYRGDYREMIKSAGLDPSNSENFRESIFCFKGPENFALAHRKRGIYIFSQGVLKGFHDIKGKPVEDILNSSREVLLFKTNFFS